MVNAAAVKKRLKVCTLHPNEDQNGCNAKHRLDPNQILIDYPVSHLCLFRVEK